ncbi:MAG TPA: hypothetical protein PK843_18040 [bacterium]|nr:hypothetical protein [bacterium]HPN36410.1 hypothetical protein [bacterium]
MVEWMRWLHLGSAGLLIGVYGLLAWRWGTRKKTAFSAFYRTLAQTGRLILLWEYLNGFILFNSYRLPVSGWHHYASLLPVAVILIFQVLPGLFDYELDEKGMRQMWLAMLITVATISMAGWFC